MYKGRSTESGESVADPALRGLPSLAPPPRRHAPPANRKTRPPTETTDQSAADGSPSARARSSRRQPPGVFSLNGFSTGISEEPSLHAFGLWTVQWRWLVFDSSLFFPSVRF